MSALCVVAASMTGCEGDSKEQGGRRASDEPIRVEPSASRPSYQFADGLQSRHPAVADFVTEFLNTCLAGDYSGYRSLVTKRRQPETKDRFQAIYYSIRKVTIDAIEQVQIPDLPGETYLVQATVTLDPESRIAVRGQVRQIAILALAEDGEWRMAPAPAALQPGQALDAGEAGADPTSAPTYLWDEGIDY